MRATMIPVRQIALMLLILTTTAPAHAFQEPPATGSSEDFENHGEITVGYRFTDVKGYQPQYQQMFNLRDGFECRTSLCTATPGKETIGSLMDILYPQVGSVATPS